MVDASMPLFAITPIAAPNSSMEMPSVAAGAPAYCMARPKSCIPSFDEFAAAWITSATCVVFAATSPVRRFQISNADVMTSDVAARSSPDATDASMMAGMAPITCCALKPPAASLSMPSAASFALMGNSAPSFPATSRICSSSSAVAPALTPAAVTVASKSMKDFTPIAPMAADAPAIGAIASAMEPSERLTPFISLARYWCCLRVFIKFSRISFSDGVTRSVIFITTSTMSAIFTSFLQLVFSRFFILDFFHHESPANNQFARLHGMKYGRQNMMLVHHVVHHLYHAVRFNQFFTSSACSSNFLVACLPNPQRLLTWSAIS